MQPSSRSAFRRVSTTAVEVGPLQKLINKDDYEKTVENIMNVKGLSREEAEKEYNQYLDNPNDYALQKGMFRS